MQRWKRIQRMLELIEQNLAPSRERLCREFECKVRTVDQDIAFLKDELLLPIEFDKTRGGYVNRNPKQKLPEFNLDEGELLVLTIGRDMLAEYGGTSFEPLLRSAFDKIESRLPEKIRVNLNDLVTAVRFKPTGIAPITRKVFFEFTKACEDQNLIDMTYYRAHDGQHTIRTIEPLRVIENRGAWYCLAWCRNRNAVRMFAMHRVVNYTVRPEHFEERDLDIDEYMDQAFLLEHGDPPQEFEIKFDSDAARYVRDRVWHPQQKLEDHPDGGCTMSFPGTSLDEVKRWVLPYGSSAEVLKPVELRKRVIKELERTLQRYSAGAKPPTVRIAAKTANRKESKSASENKRKPRIEPE